MTGVYKTRECSCTAPRGIGYPRPNHCKEHGNRFLTEAEVERRRVGVGASEQATRGHQARKSGSPGVDSSAPRRRSGLKRTSRKEPRAERAGRDNFNDKVKARACWFKWHRPCEVCLGEGEVASVVTGEIFSCELCSGSGQHVCSGRKDAHHLVPKQFLRKRFQGVLPEDQFVAILFNPLIGAPLCRKAHDRIESGADRIYWEDLTDECIEYVGSLSDFVLLRLEEESPKRSAA